MKNKLWTKDFTIITLGSVVSMFGNSMSGFAMSLMVLDYTKSPFYYALYLIFFTLPQLIMPIFSGAILDRFSRKKTIYTLDFVSAAMYLLVAVILWTDMFSFPLFAVYCFVLGSIESIYMVAYDSFYPLLVSEGNFQKAYSIASVLETLSSVMMVVSAFLYNTIGIADLLAINSVFFFVAAVTETCIGAEEKYIAKQKSNITESSMGRQFLTDIKEGFKYLSVEKGLLFVAIYFAFSSLSGGASSVISLPYFKDNYQNGEYVYMLVWGCAVVGRALGGMFHYKFKLPVNRKFAIALTVYIVLSVIEGSYLYFPIPLMMAMCFMTGVGGVTSYTIRISATQSYVPDERKARFNGAFNMINTAGSLLGEFIAGLLIVHVSERYVLTGFMALNAIAAILFIGRKRAHVKRIYNTQN